MKRLKKLAILAITLVVAITMTACGPFDGYDDDAAIVKAKSSSLMGSVVTSTSSKYEISVNKFNGVVKVKSITVPENPTFDMTVKIESGKFKVVLVKDDTVIKICESDTDEPVSVTLEAGTYSLRIVGKDAKVKFAFNYNSYN